MTQDSHVKIFFDDCQIGKTLALEQGLDCNDQITVEAWLNCSDARAEGVQQIVGQWALAEQMTGFAAYDAGHSSDLDTTGFFGAVFDGQYVYFVPQHDTESRHGKVLRLNTHSEFKDPSSWCGYDAGTTQGLNTKGYYGAAFDGRHIYFVPRRDAQNFHSRILRYDTHGKFTDPLSWQAHDAGLSCSYQSSAFDGRYIYFAPGHTAVHRDSVSEKPKFASPPVTGMDPNYYLVGNSLVMRYDTRGGFHDKSSWTTYDATGTNGLNACDYDGAVFDGSYVYFVPLSTATILRFDTRNEFESSQSWEAFDANPLGLELCVGGVFDGRHIYFVPYGISKTAVRFDTQGEFTDSMSYETYLIAKTLGQKVKGFDGAFFDGKYIYFIPYYDGGTLFHGQTLRFDTSARRFDDSVYWSSCDATTTDGLQTKGFNGGATDGRFLYYAAWMDGVQFPAKIRGNGRILRYDTVATDIGASFSLRYVDLGHNGGLCASLPGTRFLVNTERGCFSISANEPPLAGRHYIAGVYDGNSLKLYIDGKLVNERAASGRICASTANLCIGQIQNGLGKFRGSIDRLRISNIARSENWIRHSIYGD